MPCQYAAAGPVTVALGPAQSHAERTRASSVRRWPPTRKTRGLEAPPPALPDAALHPVGGIAVRHGLAQRHHTGLARDDVLEHDPSMNRN